MDNKDLPVPPTENPELEITEPQRRLLSAMVNRLNDPESMIFISSDGKPHVPMEYSFIVIGGDSDSDTLFTIWSHRKLVPPDDPYEKQIVENRTIEMSWLNKDTLEVGSVYFEDLRDNEYRFGGKSNIPFKGGVVDGKSLETGYMDEVFKSWSERGGIDCGPLITKNTNSLSAYLEGGYIENIDEISIEKLNELTLLINKSKVNTDSMKTIVNYVNSDTFSTFNSTKNNINWIKPIQITQ